LRTPLELPRPAGSRIPPAASAVLDGSAASSGTFARLRLLSSSTGPTTSATHAAAKQGADVSKQPLPALVRRRLRQEPYSASPGAERLRPLSG